MNLLAEAIPKAVTVDSFAGVTALITILSTIIGLVVWLVKQQTKRQTDVTDRYFKHLETQAERSSQVHDRYADAFAAIGDSISKQTGQLGELTANVAKQTDKIADLVIVVSKNKCQAVPRERGSSDGPTA